MSGQETADVKKTGNRILIIYYSKTGFTKKYAEWIKDVLRESLAAVSMRDRLTD